jgi:hypothetical protein
MPDLIRRALLTAAIVAVCVCACLLLLAIRSTVIQVPEVLRSELAATRTQLMGEADLLRTDVRTQADAVRTAAVVEIQATRKVAEERLLDLSLLADNRLLSIERLLGAEFQTANASIAEAVKVRQDLGPLLASSARLMDTYAAVPDRLAYANRWLWDCHDFSGCLQSQTLALVGSTRYTLGKVAKASDEIPGMTKDFRDITGDVRRVADKWTAPVPLWRKILGFTPTAARVAGEVW